MMDLDLSLLRLAAMDLTAFLLKDILPNNLCHHFHASEVPLSLHLGTPLAVDLAGLSRIMASRSMS
jgi:hypothetical protein